MTGLATEINWIKQLLPAICDREVTALRKTELWLTKNSAFPPCFEGHEAVLQTSWHYQTTARKQFIFNLTVTQAKA